MKKSAGILVYKKVQDQVFVLLVHPGGPYWKNKQEGAWSIPKGEYDQEEALEAAVREFHEETNLTVDPVNLSFLGSEKVSNNKLATIFTIEQDLATDSFESNCFSLEWPPKSGQFQDFPEMDAIQWFSLEEAETYILKNQIKFLRKLQDKIKA